MPLDLQAAGEDILKRSLQHCFKKAGHMGHRSFLVGAAFALSQIACTPALAADRLRLWENLEAGMTKSEVKALYPDARIPLSQGCYAVLDFEFDDNGLHRINMDWSTHDSEESACGLSVLRSLLGKYGDPSANQILTEVGDCPAGKLGSLCRLNGPSVSRRQFISWDRDKIRITLRINPDNPTPHHWHLSYEPLQFVTVEPIDKL